jgi:hypothetical protein
MPMFYLDGFIVAVDAEAIESVFPGPYPLRMAAPILKSITRCFSVSGAGAKTPLRERLLDLGLGFLRAERLDDIAADAGLSRRDDIRSRVNSVRKMRAVAL